MQRRQVALELQAELKNQNKTIGFVPTMGALHEGHLSLIKKAKAENELVVVSIYVNPEQFGPNEDLSKYPKTLEEDLNKLEALNVDIVFLPTTEEIYPDGRPSKIKVGIQGISSKYCGEYRPGHFEGVCTIVSRLYNIVQPTNAYFGEKDFQQFKVIQEMTKALFFPVTLHCCPIVREDNGLAMSSRNQYLNAEEKLEASLIYQALKKTKEASNSNKNVKTLRSIFNETLKNSSISTQYLVFIDENSFEEVDVIKQNNRILFAGFLKTTRLIDTIAL